MSIIVYHGGTDIRDSPKADMCRPNLDFGIGFYVTVLRKQATEWAVKVATRRMSIPVVNKYALNRDAVLKEFRCRIFPEYNGEWLDFIVASRIGQKPWLPYDYIEGGVADDRVIDTINLYMSDLISRDKALERLSEHHPNTQICLLSQDLIDKYLDFHGTESI